jgi:protein-disulfide isomerase
MHNSFRSIFRIYVRELIPARSRGFASAAFAALLLSAFISAQGQSSASSALKPPAGARVAIVEFDDLECPACAHANPLLMQAVAKYKIPWVRHDFLISYHNWSKYAALNARWLDIKSKALGDEYRNEVFAHQNSIETPAELSQFTQKFAQSHGVALPFAIDPQGKLIGEINADGDLGRQLGVTQTPTIYIVTDGASIKVNNPDTELYSDIDRAFAEARASAPVSSAHR